MPRKTANRSTIEKFNFAPGTVLANKYEVISQIGSGWESEVYIIREQSTRIERAAKVFFPHRNPRLKNSAISAKKAFKLRECPIVVQYHAQEKIDFEGHRVSCLVSEYVEGEMLSEFIERLPGKRMPAFQALHLLHAMVKGIEEIHKKGEYHGDLHSDNVIIRRYGLGFDMKLIDLHHWGPSNKENLQDDIFDMIKVFHEALGGIKAYSKQPQWVKEIVCGQKRSLVLKKFRTVTKLREHLERLEWN